MSIDILEITADSALLLKTFPDLSETTIRVAAAGLAGRTAWIVPLTVRDELAKLDGVIDDRGKKHEAVPLSRLLKVRRAEIPMVDGNYSTDGKLRQGVQTFLHKGGEGAQRLFVIATTKHIFDKLVKLSVPFDTDDLAGTDDAGNREIRDLLSDIIVPPDLKKRFIGTSIHADIVRRLIKRAAEVDNTVLITGDTGTGKEVVAQQIREYSSRKGKPYRVVNCAAFPHDLLESELFGHVKGAFTGALTTNDGLWHDAGDGILFLDEIGELSPAHQAKILRVLQEGKVRKVGGSEEIKVKARVICATNRNLFAMVNAGQFRKDLYYRLRDFLITIPPLRDHKCDIPLLVRSFWKEISQGKTVLPDAIILALHNYSWPGNVRELKMVLNHLFAMSSPLQPEMRHLRLVFAMQEMELDTESGLAVDQHLVRISSFRHLRQVFETFRAVEHRLTPLLNGEKPKPRQLPHISTITNQLNELAQYNQTPQQFSPLTYENISRLRSRLIHFLNDYERDSAKAVANLRDGTRRVLEDAVADILGEIEQVLEGGSSSG